MRLQPTCDLVCFDLDGTLVDTASEIAEAANRALDAHCIARRPPAEITLLIGNGTRELMLKLLATCYLADPALASRVRTEDVLASMDQHYAVTTGTSAVPYGGTRDALRRLRAAGVHLACVTNKEVRHARRVLKATRLEDYFELVIGGDSLPEKKPHASVLRHVAQTFRVDTRRTAHVGDSAIDVRAARNAGVAAWAVPYGYNAGVPVAESQPDQIFLTLADAADAVLHAQPMKTRAAGHDLANDPAAGAPR